MDIKSLKTFQMIVKHGSFNRAAEEMNYVQSTVTMQIQKLEFDLGVQLIERGKKISLTEAGRLFYEQSLQIVKSMEQLQANLSDLQQGEAGNVRLGVTDPTGSYRLPEKLAMFLKQHPKIRVSVDFGSTSELCEKLKNGELDAALCSTPDLGSELYFEPLFTEAFVLLLPENHPLAEKRTILAEDLTNYCLLITDGSCPYRKKLEMILKEAGSLAPHTMEIGSMTALHHYVEKGLGIALVPQIVVNPVPDGTVVRSVSGSPIDMICGIATNIARNPMTAATLKLYHFLKSELRDKK